MNFHRISTRISKASDNYSFYLFCSKPLDQWHGQVLNDKIYRLSQESDIHIEDYIRVLTDEVLKLKTLVIESSSSLDYKQFLKFSKSYLFYLACNRNLVIYLRENPFQVNSTVVYSDQYISSSKIIGQNLDDELIDYYKRRVLSEDPFIQFISFYHVIEYFFEIIIKSFKSPIISIPKDFERNEKEIKIFFNKNIGEEKKLFLVLLKFIELNELKKQLDSITEFFYPQLKNPVKFAEAKAIEEENFHETLSNRIYRIRNALVHRKEAHKEKYLSFNNDHREELKKEIPIIRAIAMQIILKYSEKSDN